jgi:hypothetical protein
MISTDILGLTISNARISHLHSFIIEGTGCLPKSVLQGIAACQWPNLTSLELWLGSNEEGYLHSFSWSCDDLVKLNKRSHLTLNQSSVFSNLPNLQCLALRNSSDTNGIVECLVESPDLIQNLNVLDLSYGILDDDGANVLSEGMPLFHNLTELMLTHHFVSADILKHRFKEGLFIIETEAEPEYWQPTNTPRFL